MPAKANLVVHYGPFSHTFTLPVPQEKTLDELLAIDTDGVKATVTASKSTDGVLFTVVADLPVLGAQTLTEDLPLGGIEEHVAEFFLADGKQFDVSLEVFEAAA